MRGDFRNLIVTDIPQPHPVEREPLAIERTSPAATPGCSRR